MLGESSSGKGSQSTAPSRATSATVRPSPIAAYASIGAYPPMRRSASDTSARPPWPVRGGAQRAQLGLDAAQQLPVGVAERSHALTLELGRDGPKVHAF